MHAGLGSWTDDEFEQKPAPKAASLFDSSGYGPQMNEQSKLPTCTMVSRFTVLGCMLGQIMDST